MMNAFLGILRVTTILAVLLSLPSVAGAGLEERESEVQTAIERFKKADSSLTKFFDTAVGYAVFPGVGKGAIGVGGAHGKGLVYARGKNKKVELIGETGLTQVTIGFQLGGQAYQEVIFFEDVTSLEAFKDGKFALSAQASAVAASSGAAANAKYEMGVAVFTLAKSGLMYEASVGGQKFSFKAVAKEKK